MSKKITDYTLYRWRFIIGYTIVALAGIIVLGIALFIAPGGVSDAEKSSVITTSALSFSSIVPESIVNAPYHIMQWLSIRVLGVTTLSIKLPSVIIAVLTGIGIVGLLSAWFRRNVAVLAAAIAVTTGQFLFLSQLATPEIMPIFWSTWILFSALMVSRRYYFNTIWKIIMFGCIALSLYTPLSAYMIVALVTAVIFHPHLRYLVRQMTTWKVLVALIISAALISPLVYAIVAEPSIVQTLLGIPDHMPVIVDNLVLLVREYLSFIQPSEQLLLTPVYSLGAVLFAVLGIVRFFGTKYTARAYILGALIVLTIPLMIFNPRNVEITFVPMMLLVAFGISWLFRRWYSLFPVNPYARIVGLIPLSILLCGIIAASVTRYVGTMTYSPAQVNEFSHDLSLVTSEVARQKHAKLQIVVPQNDVAFYRVFAEYNDRVTVTTEYEPGSYSPMLVSRGVVDEPPTDNMTRILVDNKSHDANRFYLYTK